MCKIGIVINYIGLLVILWKAYCTLKQYHSQHTDNMWRQSLLEQENIKKNLNRTGSSYTLLEKIMMVINVTISRLAILIGVGIWSITIEPLGSILRFDTPEVVLAVLSGICVSINYHVSRYLCYLSFIKEFCLVI